MSRGEEKSGERRRYRVFNKRMSRGRERTGNTQ